MAQNICTELSKAWQAPQHGAVSTHLELAEHIDEDAAVEHGLAVHGRDEVRDLLEGQATQLLHDLRRALGGESDQAHGYHRHQPNHDHPGHGEPGGRHLHLLALEGEEGLLGVVERLELRPRGRVIEHLGAGQGQAVKRDQNNTTGR